VPEITSRHHPLVKAFKTAARGEGPLALVDGWHLLHDAVAAGVTIDRVAITGQPPSAADAALLTRLSSDAAEAPDVVVSVSSTVMDVLSPVRTPAGVAALVQRPHVDRAQLFVPAPPLIVVAIDVQDPGNLGAVIRSAEAGGATGVVVAGASADPWSWKALRAAMGSTFRLPVHAQADEMAACDALSGQGLSLLAAVPRDGVSMHTTDLRAPIAFLLGGEGRGLSAALVSRSDARISIPMNGPVESLNVAVAAALLVYEARRQRGTIDERRTNHAFSV
jgi:RNA methyltransferase, TrmH family